MKKIFISLLFLMFNGNLVANVSCDTNCRNKCRPNRHLPPEPVCYTSCESTKKVMCDVVSKVINMVGAKVGQDPKVVSAARDGGWTKSNCIGNGLSLCTAVAALYSTPICAAAGAALGTGPCLAAVLASGAAITGIACTQLCNDGNLRGSECGN